ncbi:Uncharacterised protein [Bordetella pertussis]|nr:Uncharacterised protein [Bordetella pertussis]
MGTSGSSAERSLEVTARACSLPALMKGIALEAVTTARPIWLPSTSLSAGPQPLYGTCTICVLALTLSSSPARCCGVPLPHEP